VTTGPGPVDSHDEPVGAAGAAFVQIAKDALDDLLRLDPVTATGLGEHRYDDRLPDRTQEGLDEARRVLTGWLGAVDAVDEALLSLDHRVDHEMLRSALSARLFELDDLRPYAWDPLTANPGTAVYLLLARDFAPLGDRLRSVAGRLAAVPAALATARSALGEMPRVHVETALGQFRGTRALVAGEVAEAVEKEPTMRAEVEPARLSALEALDDHIAWLEATLSPGGPVGADRDPRLGPELYAAKLWHALDTETPPDSVLVRAESDLMRVEAEIADLVGGRDPRQVLDELAEDGYVDDSTVLGLCAQALEETTAFVRAQDIVSVPERWDDAVRIIEMPEIHRGVAVAYCDAPGPLEPADLPTFFAVSPAPADWPAEQVRSFYREYNAHQLRNLTVHEAMPGHVLQLAHSRASARSARPAESGGRTPVRAALYSGPFVEGWAVYAEEVMVRAGFGGTAVALQQLKMQLRSTINAILDVRVHAHGMTEHEAMSLMTGRGHQEVGEAAGKWRRALLTSAQLSTYYVGYSEVVELSRRLAADRSGRSTRARHDEMLAHGSPPPRHLRTLLGV
jgi:uncharacterized protein (DUF885 family)